MPNITYEQFESWCKYWNMTIEEGYKAMCFTSNIIHQNATNYNKYANEVHSDEFKPFVETYKDNAMKLSNHYDDLNTKVYTMLEKHDEEQLK